jgi:hypothetical protein
MRKRSRLELAHNFGKVYAVVSDYLRFDCTWLSLPVVSRECAGTYDIESQPLIMRRKKT